MYGMVNSAILECVSRHYGEEAVQQVRSKANAETDVFLSMQQYADQESVLKSDYGNLLRMAGDSLPEILMNLDNLHVRVGHAFPRLEPPLSGAQR